MYLLGHTGISLGVAWAASFALGEQREISPYPRWSRWRVDYRLVIVGSMLPDLIDKPLGMWILADLFSNGRVVSHTLAFNLLLIAIGIALILWRNNSGWLTLGLASSGHLLLDQMWREPSTLLWPFYGLPFPRLDLAGYPLQWVQALYTSPSIYVPEILGGAILFVFALRLAHKRGLAALPTRRLYSTRGGVPVAGGDGEARP